MKRKNYIIFDSYDIYSEENMKIAKESMIENAFLILMKMVVSLKLTILEKMSF